MWWQPDPGGGGWQAWDGWGWKAASPAGESPYRPSGADVPAKTDSFEGKVPEPIKRALVERESFLAVSQNVPLTSRSHAWWDLLSIIAGFIGAFIWLVSTGISGQLDFFTPIIMAFTSPALIATRPQTDPLLFPIQPYRNRIPHLALLLLGLVSPFIIGFIFTTILGGGFPLAPLTMLIGIGVAYIIMREPRYTQKRTGSPAITMLIMVLSVLLIIAPVTASDMMSLPCFCLDEMLWFFAAIPPAVLAVLLNGRSVFRRRHGKFYEVPFIRPLEDAFRMKVAEKKDEGFHTLRDDTVRGDWADHSMDAHYWDSLTQFPVNDASTRGVAWSEEFTRSITGAKSWLAGISISYKLPFEPKDVIEWLQIIVENNHMATRVILPDGSRMILDYWTAISGGDPRLVSEPEWIRLWRTQVGEHYAVARTLEEQRLKEYISYYGFDKARQEFIAALPDRKSDADLLIRSWRWAPW